MGSEIVVYLRLGFEHISDIRGYDHILFIAALCAVYQLRQWRHLLWLVTAFTVGHSITLALATLRLISINDQLVEFLIPLTIFATSIINIIEPQNQARDRAERFKYVLALCFGLIHGMGFSNFLRAVLGGEESIVVPLFSFNVGLELGQITIVIVILAISTLMVRLAIKPRDWALVLSGATAGIAVTLMIERMIPLLG